MCSYSGYADLASCASTTRSHRIAIAMRARSSPSYDHARRWTGDWLRSRRVLSQLGPHSPTPARQTFPPIWEITHEESHCVDARERTISPPAPVCSRPSWISRLTHARFGGTQRRRPAQGRGAQSRREHGGRWSTSVRVARSLPARVRILVLGPQLAFLRLCSLPTLSLCDKSLFTMHMFKIDIARGKCRKLNHPVR